MDLSKILSNVRGKFSGVLAAIKGFFAGLSSLKDKLPRPEFKKPDFSGMDERSKSVINKSSAFIGKLKVLINGRLQSIPESKRKPFIMGLGGLAGVFILITALAVDGNKEKNTPHAALAGITMSQDELFLPAEPDFVPDFILEREPRLSWSLEDIRPYWKAPDITEHWRAEIKSAVDKLMEGIP